jgi:hypothetical protein
MGQVRSAEQQLCRLEEVSRRCALDPLLVRKLAQHVVSLERSPQIFSFARVFSFGALLRFLARTFGESRGGEDMYAFVPGRLMYSRRFPALALKAKQSLVMLIPADKLPVHVSIRGQVSGRQEDDPMHFRLDGGGGAGAAAASASRVGGVLARSPEPDRGVMVSRGFAEETTALVEANLGAEAAERWGRCLVDMDALFAAAWMETEEPGAGGRSSARNERDAQLLLAFAPVHCPPEERAWRRQPAVEAGAGEAGASEAEPEPEPEGQTAGAGEPEPEGQAAGAGEPEPEGQAAGAGEPEPEGQAAGASEAGAEPEPEGQTAGQAAGAGEAGAEPEPEPEGQAAAAATGETASAAGAATAGSKASAVPGRPRMSVKALAAWMADREAAAREVMWSSSDPVSWLELLLVFGGMAGGEDVAARLKREGIEVTRDADGLLVLPRALTPEIMTSFSNVLSVMRERLRGSSFEVAGGPEGMDVFMDLLQATRDADVGVIAGLVRSSGGGDAEGEDLQRAVMRFTTARQRRMVDALDAVFKVVPVRDWPELSRQLCVLVASRFPQLRGTLIERLPARLLLAALPALIPGDTVPPVLAALPEIAGPHSSLDAALEEEAQDPADLTLRRSWVSLLRVYYQLERQAAGSDLAGMGLSILIELLRRPFGQVSREQFRQKIANIRAPTQQHLDVAMEKLRAITDEEKRKRAKEMVGEKLRAMMNQIAAIDSYEKRMLSSGLF